MLQRCLVNKNSDGLLLPEGRKLDWAPYFSMSCPKYSQRKPRFTVSFGLTLKSSWK